MPNWKKVIVSGSNAVLNNITSSGNINASGTIISNNKNVVSQSGAFTNNEFIIAVGDGAVTSSDALAVDSDGNLGIGIPNPEVRLHMLGEDAQTTQILMEQFNNTTDAPDIRTRRYRGTSASRADVQTGDYLFRLNVHGQDDGSSEVYGSMRFDVDSLDQDALEWGLQTRDTAGTVADRIKINSSGDSEFTSNITASGNISSSGTLQGASLKVDDGTNLLGGKRFITSDSKYEFRDGSVHVSSGHITASGNISASGTITAATLDATAVSDTLAAAVVAEIDNDEIPIAKLAEDAVTVTAGTNLSNGGTVTLGGSITLNVDDAFLKNDADDTTSGTITSAGLIATKDTDGGNTTIQIINSNTDGGVDKGAGIEFKHGSALGALSGNQRAGKILSTKASSYQGTTAAVDSNLEFYTANNDTDTLQLKIDNTGLAEFTGNISASGTSTGSLGRIEADSFSKTIVTSHHNMSLDGNSATVDYYIPINSLADGSGASLYYTRILPAYNGRVLKILFRPSVAMGSSCIIYMSRRAHDGTSVSHQTSGFQASETFDGSALSTVIVPCAQGGANAANWVFEEGDQLGFSLVKNTTGTTTDLTMTVVYEYDII